MRNAPSQGGVENDDDAVSTEDATTEDDLTGGAEVSTEDDFTVRFEVPQSGGSAQYLPEPGPPQSWDPDKRGR